VPSTRNGDSAPTIAPGAENVGQAQILTAFSKPFELEGLFGAADAGAFSKRQNDDFPMGAMDEDGDVFWDAVESPEMVIDSEDGVPMESDDLKHVIPRKRSRSPSEAPPPSASTSTSIMPADMEAASRHSRQPKRQRKSKEVPSYEAPPDQHVLDRMGKSNPLGRKALKRDAKKARKAGRVRGQHTPGATGMEVDEESGLQFTFMA